MNNISNPVVDNVAALRANITSVPALKTPTHEYARPSLLAPVRKAGPTARTLNEFVKPLGSDPDEILKHRYLCRGGGLLLVGATGLGKSSLAMQLMIKWALGQPEFGLEPARPLKSWLIQAENDDGDLAEMKEGVFNGLNMGDEEKEMASQNICVTQESGKTGTELCEDVIEQLIEEVQPDLLWLDPALAYIGGDMNSQQDVGKFLRNDIGPLLAKHNCAAIIIHHTNKISKDPEKQMTDVSYLGAGSAEWVNWCRAMLALRKTDVDNMYELIAAKRGARLKWKMEDGESLTFKKYLGHSKRPDTICWHELAINQVKDLQANNGKSAADVLKHVPHDLLVGKEELIQACQRSGIGKNKMPKLIEELVKSGSLFEHRARRSGAKPKVMLSREAVSVAESLLLDQYTQNSQGHYIIPSPKLEMEA